MANILLPEDFPSLAINDGQTRDFANRILYGLADRLSVNKKWTRIGFERHMDEGDIKHNTAFKAYCSPEYGGFGYSLGFATIFPVDDELLTTEVLDRVLRVTQEAEDDIDTDVQDRQPSPLQKWFDGIRDDDDDEIGYLALERGYHFVIPYRRSWCKSTKMMSITFLDEDGESMGEELGYIPDNLVSNVPLIDVENLFRFEEALADTPRYEEEMSQITFNDLDFMVNSLKALKLLRSSAQPLSSKVL